MITASTSTIKAAILFIYDRLLLRFRYGRSERPPGFWIGPIVGVRNARAAHVLFFQLGADRDLPWRPWPQRLTERRGRSGGSVATWIACCGVGVGYQRTAA